LFGGFCDSLPKPYFDSVALRCQTHLPFAIDKEIALTQKPAQQTTTKIATSSSEYPLDYLVIAEQAKL
jgi:hypothetical protein